MTGCNCCKIVMTIPFLLLWSGAECLMGIYLLSTYSSIELKATGISVKAIIIVIDVWFLQDALKAGFLWIKGKCGRCCGSHRKGLAPQVQVKSQELGKPLISADTAEDVQKQHEDE